MSWVTVIWSVGGGACLTLAFLQVIVWWKDRTARANLVFSVLAIAVATFAALELASMRAETHEQFGTVVRWMHVSAWVMIACTVAFVRLYLKAGRKWLAWAVVGVRTVSLILNFVLSPNINYRQITALRHISFLGESVSVAEGVPNPWMLIAQLSLLLFVIFVTDAMITVWRRGDWRRALTVGGSILLFVVMSTVQAVAVTWGIISMPMTVSLFYLILVAAMAYELSHDLARAAALARQLQESEAGLRQFEERVALAAEAAQLGVWEFDMTTQRIWVSDKVRQLFQFPPTGDITYAEFQKHVHPDDRGTRDQIMRRALRTQSGYETEYRILLPDGNLRWIGGRARCLPEGDGKSMRLVGVSMDITERKQAQELFQLATEASPSGTVLVDNQGRIVLVNSHVEKLFGYARDELIGEAVDILVPERFARAHATDRTNFFEVPETRAMGAGRELFARRKDGSEFPVEIGLSPIQTRHGLLVLANVVDISARKAAEEDARRSREQVELLSRVSLLGEMAASLAHELNQPLSAIVNNATAAMQYLEQGRLDPGRLRDILTDVVGDGCRAHDIIRDVRSAIKRGSAIRARINLNDVVKTVAHMVQPDAAAQFCQMKMSLAPDLPAIEGDPTQIQQVLINLVRNALDAMRDTPPQPPDRGYCHELQRRRNDLRLGARLWLRNLRDNAGAAFRAILYYERGRSRNGSCHRALHHRRTRRNHCRRKCRWRGSPFLFSSANQRGNSRMMTPTAVVFVIDDDESMRKSLERLLDAAHYKTELFKSASEFLARSAHSGPSCVIVDVKMPGLNGMDLQKNLIERGSEEQLVFITGHGNVPMCAEAMKAGAVDFLPKPFRPRQLLESVERALTRSAEQRRHASEKNHARSLLGRLTPREYEVMQLVATGLLNKQIGGALGMAEKTVKTHRAHMMQKLGITSVAELMGVLQKAEVPPVDRPGTKVVLRSVDVAR